MEQTDRLTDTKPLLYAYFCDRDQHNNLLIKDEWSLHGITILQSLVAGIYVVHRYMRLV